MEGGVRRLADQFLGAKAEHPTRGRIQEGDAAVGVRAENALGAGVEDEPRALFTDLEQLLLRVQLLLLGQQFFLLRQQFLLRLRQRFRLFLQLAGLFPRLVQ